MQLKQTNYMTDVICHKEHLIILYEEYWNGHHKLHQEILIKDIKIIKILSGTKGGFMGFNIVDKSDKTIICFSRKQRQLLLALRESPYNLKFEIV